jgi:predicted membrane metal-binding protein
MKRSSPKEFAEKTHREAVLWIRAAWTLPFVCLAGLFFVHFIGWEHWYEKALVVGATVFFAVSTYWWWWAVFKILNIAEILNRTVENFESVKKELNKFKNDIKKK